MSSKIKVDTIENVAGSGNVSLGSGHNLVVPGTLNITGASTLTGGIANAGTITAGTLGSSIVFPAGHVVQRQSTKTNTAYTNSTTTFSDITGATLTVTPKFASSTLLIKYVYSINVYTSGTNTNAGGVVRLVHDGTALDYNASGNYEHYYQNDAGSGTGPNNYARAIKIAEVAASNTNARVIKAQGRIYSAVTAGLRINQGDYYTSYFIVEEIAG